jgi:D-ala D-ala ligase C-terminus
LEMKKVALSVMQPDGFKVPAWRFVYSPDELEEFVTNNNLAALGTTTTRMRFPMITKHFSSYSSIGLTEKSKCGNIDELREQATIMLQKYGGCLIEEFVEGREYTVLTAQVPSADGTGTFSRLFAFDALLLESLTSNSFSSMLPKICNTFYKIQVSTTWRMTRLNANSATVKNSSIISSNGSTTIAFRGIRCTTQP